MRRKTGKGSNILLFLVFLLGVGVLCYPMVASYVNAKHQSRVVENYESTVENLSGEALAAKRASAEEFNRLLWQKNGTSFGTLGTLETRYWGEMDIDGLMGYISIPKIGVNLSIAHGTEEETLARSCGHVEGSSLPIGGGNTHAVLSGHRGLPSSKLFTDLDQLQVNDTFYIHSLGETLAYQVDQIETVLPEETERLGIIPDGDYVTLVTCTPYGINTHRLLVRGTRIPYASAQERAAEQLRTYSSVALLIWLLVGGTVFAALLCVLLIPRHYRKKAEKNVETKGGGSHEKTDR